MLRKHEGGKHLFWIMPSGSPGPIVWAECHGRRSMQRRSMLIAVRKQKERKEEDILISPCFCHL